jgi:hypothetical protein
VRIVNHAERDGDGLAGLHGGVGGDERGGDVRGLRASGRRDEDQ